MCIFQSRSCICSRVKDGLVKDEVKPWMGGWAPSMANNEAHWLLPLMELVAIHNFWATPLRP
jgi:hypothetical protein